MLGRARGSMWLVSTRMVAAVASFASTCPYVCSSIDVLHIWRSRSRAMVMPQPQSTTQSQPCQILTLHASITHHAIHAHATPPLLGSSCLHAQLSRSHPCRKCADHTRAASALLEGSL